MRKTNRRPKPLLLYGAGDFAQTAAELTRHCGHSVLGLIDGFGTGKASLGTLEVVAQSHPPGQHAIALAIGYNDLAARWAAWRRACALGYATPSLVHPRAYVADSARIGKGALIMAGAVVDVRAVIGEAVVLWPGACINHDAVIVANTFISPNATVCGFAHVGMHCFVGAGAAIVDRAEVPEGGFIKMLQAYSQRAA